MVRLSVCRMALAHTRFIDNHWQSLWVIGLMVNVWSTTLLLPTLLSDSQVSISLVIHGL